MNGLSGILLYAELLSNIRQISVGCSLSSPGSKDTQALISADGKTLTVRHEGDEKSLQLPAQVKVTGVLPVKQSESLGLSWRLPLATATELARPVPSPLDIQTVPWSASDVCSGCAVKCRKCETTIIEQDAVKVWKDLPSENWAEMMEFWHCHKPDNHDQEHVGDEPHLAGRGYGASSRISGQTGTGFVDLTSFLFSETDCTNLKVSSISSPSVSFI